MKRLLAMGAVLAWTITASTPARAGAAFALTLTNVQVEGGAVYLLGNFPNPDGCGQSSFAMVTSDNLDKDRILSMAISAHLNNRVVSGFINGCQMTQWGHTVPKIVQFKI
jgi:hypothetical protein